MKAIHLDRMTTYGHGCFPPTLGLSTARQCLVNNKPPLILGDPIQPHCCGGCHGGSFQGQHRVIVNNKSIQIDGDPISCGDTARGTSHNIFVGR